MCFLLLMHKHFFPVVSHFLLLLLRFLSRYFVFFDVSLELSRREKKTLAHSNECVLINHRNFCWLATFSKRKRVRKPSRGGVWGVKVYVFRFGCVLTFHNYVTDIVDFLPLYISFWKCQKCASTIKLFRFFVPKKKMWKTLPQTLATTKNQSSNGHNFGSNDFIEAIVHIFIYWIVIVSVTCGMPLVLLWFSTLAHFDHAVQSAYLTFLSIIALNIEYETRKAARTQLLTPPRPNHVKLFMTHRCTVHTHTNKFLRCVPESASACEFITL